MSLPLLEDANMKLTLEYGNGFFKIFYSFIHVCIHCLGDFSSLLPAPSLSPTPPRFQAEPVLPLSRILLKRRHKHNKKDKELLLVELRIAIQRDS
jgi:hypothetical protein